MRLLLRVMFTLLIAIPVCLALALFIALEVRRGASSSAGASNPHLGGASQPGARGAAA